MKPHATAGRRRKTSPKTIEIIEEYEHPAHENQLIVSLSDRRGIAYQPESLTSAFDWLARLKPLMGLFNALRIIRSRSEVGKFGKWQQKRQWRLQGKYA